MNCYDLPWWEISLLSVIGFLVLVGLYYLFKYSVQSCLYTYIRGLSNREFNYINWVKREDLGAILDKCMKRDEIESRLMYLQSYCERLEREFRNHEQNKQLHNKILADLRRKNGKN